jgi:hypothetical protein
MFGKLPIFAPAIVAGSMLVPLATACGGKTVSLGTTPS